MTFTVSVVKQATDTETHNLDALSAVGYIRAGRWGEKIKEIRDKLNGDPTTRELAQELKKHLPGILWSGTFEKRGNAALIQHSGLLCADLDHLNGRRDEVAAKLRAMSKHLWALFVSPSGRGLKAVFRVPPDKEKHTASFRAIGKHVEDLADVQIDEACKDVARLCFVSHDPDIFFNPAASEIEPLPEPPKPNRLTSGNVDLSARQRIAADLLGPLDWQDETRGFVACPGAARHTTSNGERDCEVYLDPGRPPTIHCVHNSCRPVIDALNRELRSRIGKAEWKPEPAVQKSEESRRFTLPEIEDGAFLCSQPVTLPADVVEGILHKGGKMVLGGGSKSFKTWTLIDLATAVAAGIGWLGQFPAKRGRVLYANFELPGVYFQSRLQRICDANQIHLEPDFFSLWNLRGYGTAFWKLLPEMIEKAGRGRYDLIVLDPIYKLLGGRDENKAGDVGEMLNEIERLSVATGAAVAFGAHYSKGNQAVKDPIDRVGGSGVFARDPDSILNFTRHEEDDCFTIDATLRNHPPIKSFVVRWDFPLFVCDNALDPRSLRKPGPAEQFSADDLLELITEPMKTTEIIQIAMEELGCATRPHT